ncbi:MAG: hypothetical protein P4M07_05390, partial [Xanthobacteraceae bacterium]|nr:hypothetical protein [Xanthobacteraceae bacterium]
RCAAAGRARSAAATAGAAATAASRSDLLDGRRQEGVPMNRNGCGPTPAAASILTSSDAQAASAAQCRPLA